MQNISHGKRHSLVNRNITVRDRETSTEIRTSIRLEQIEWEAMKNICVAKGITINEFCCDADMSPARPEHSRTSRIRTAILHHYINGEHNKHKRKEYKS